MLPNSLKRQAIPLPDIWFDDVWNALDTWPSDQYYLVLGGSRSRFTLIALSWDEEDWQEFSRSAPTSQAQAPGESWTTGHLAIHAYDQKDSGGSIASRVFRIKQSLVIDHHNRGAELCQEPGWERCRHQLDWAADSRQPIRGDEALPLWKSHWTDEQYMQSVAEALEDIRSGRYYQINLLRYWQTNDAVSRSQWLQQLAKMGGPFSAYVHVPDLQLVSFSPERFFKLGTDPDGRWIETEPIKGTRPVVADPVENQRQIEFLMASRKDEAELNMIVDLLRNDLFRVCIPSSVKVLDPGSLHSFANVHHRIARIRGRLQENLDLGQVLDALCPGGSITGAPKQEVMKAIKEKEARPREYFMGNIMYRDAFTGQLDSSILIRTALRKNQGPWEFAAGSGLVIHSDPAEELAEILVKAKVLLGAFA